MKTYKHKKLWFEAIKMDNWFYDIANTTEHCSNVVPAYIIEDSDDWELVKNKDWVAGFIDFIRTTEVTTETQEDIYRDYINKHLPKICKMDLDTLYQHTDDISGMQFVSKLDLVNLLESRLLYIGTK